MFINHYDVNLNCCRHSFDTEVLTRSHSPPQNFTSKNSKLLIKPQVDKLRRISTGSMKIEVTGEKTPTNQSQSQSQGQGQSHWESNYSNFKKCELTVLEICKCYI